MPAPKDPIKKEEWKRKISLGNAGKLTGRSRSEETKEKIRKGVNENYLIHPEIKEILSLRAIEGYENGRVPPMKGKKRNDEWKLKQSLAKRGISFEEKYGEERAKEIKEKISQKTMTLYEDPEYRGGFQRGHKRFTKDRKGKTYEEIYGEEKAKEMKEKISLAEIKRFSDPKEREQSRRTRLTQVFPKVSSIETEIQEELKKRGYKFEAQCPFEITLIDIAFPEKRVAIYVDGDYWHKLPGYKERDERCNKFLEERDWKVLRFWEHEIKGDLEGCMKRIEEVITIGE